MQLLVASMVFLVGNQFAHWLRTYTDAKKLKASINLASAQSIGEKRSNIEVHIIMVAKGI